MRDREIIFRNEPHHLLLWIIILISFLILGIIMINYTYSPYYHTVGIYEKENKSISIVLASDKVSDIKNSHLKINNQKIDNYEININDYFIDNNKLYYELKIFLNAEFEDKFLSVVIELPKTTILKQIKKGLI